MPVRFLYMPHSGARLVYDIAGIITVHASLTTVYALNHDVHGTCRNLLQRAHGPIEMGHAFLRDRYNRFRFWYWFLTKHQKMNHVDYGTGYTPFYLIAQDVPSCVQTLHVVFYDRCNRLLLVEFCPTPGLFAHAMYGNPHIRHSGFHAHFPPRPGDLYYYDTVCTGYFALPN